MSHWSDKYQKDLDDKLAPRDRYDLAAEALEQHASANTYSGPIRSGDQLAGWPVSELLNILPKGMEPHVHAALRRRNRQIMGNVSYGGGGAGGLGSINIAIPNTRQHSLEEMMAMRMRWGAIQEGYVAPWAVGFAHMAMHAVGDTVHIWIITKDGKDVVLEDDHGLYPSDGLITKIRLLQSGETE